MATLATEPTIVVCDTCGHELAGGADCAVWTYDQFVGRAGYHGGACWGGRFPTKEQMQRAYGDGDDEDDVEPPLPIDKEAARERGELRARRAVEQLDLFAETDR